jgi:hypothetical protein
MGGGFVSPWDRGSMKCSTCNLQIPSESNFCPRCGAAVGATAEKFSSDIDSAAPNYERSDSVRLPAERRGVTTRTVAILFAALFAIYVFYHIVAPLGPIGETPDIRVEMLNNVGLKITNLSSQEIEVQNVIINNNPDCVKQVDTTKRLRDDSDFAGGALLGAAIALKTYGMLPTFPVKLNRMGQTTMVGSLCAVSIPRDPIIQAEIITNHGTQTYSWK